MKKINIAELLKDCPKGMELYSPIFGEVYLDKIRPHLAIVVATDKEQGDFKEEFLYDGRYGMNGECMLFPSKGKTTWEGFIPPCKFKDGDIVYTVCGSIAILRNIPNIYYSTQCGLFGDIFDINVIVSPMRLATEEEKAKLFQAIKNNGYKWNAETKTLEKLTEPYKEETMENKLGQITLDIPDGYEFFGINDDNKVVLTKIQPQYPKTYEECAKLLDCFGAAYIDGYKNELLEKLQELLICRDAYWKIAGEQMGLGKPWKPDWENKEDTKYCITKINNQVKLLTTDVFNYILSFPTEEMRDAFYGNFKELIEECKEFL